MRINVYSQELTDEVIHIEKQSNTGIVYHAAQLVLHSSPMLHHPPRDDDRSAVTFWLPRSAARREAVANAWPRCSAPRLWNRSRSSATVAPLLKAPDCWCSKCDLAANPIPTHMAICPQCGDKRCPRAADHEAACAASPEGPR